MFSYTRRRFLHAIFTRRGITGAEPGGNSLGTYTNDYHPATFRRLIHVARRDYSSDVKLDPLRGMRNVRAADLTVQPPSDDFLSRLDEESRHRVKVFCVEMEVLRESGSWVPEQLTDAHWAQILSLPKRWARIQLYSHLKSCEYNADLVRERDRRHKAAARAETRERAARPYDPLEYAINRNNIMPVLSFSELKVIWDVRLCQAMIHGPKLVLDLGFAHLMDASDAARCVKFIAFMIGNNRSNREPFDLYLCNAMPGSFLYAGLLSAFPNLRSKEILMNVTEKSYLDLFPKERLVYLTTDSHYSLMKYNPDDVCIIGGLWTRDRAGPVAQAKAKREGIRTRRLPVLGQLNLPEACSLRFDQTFRLLLDFKNLRDWNKAMDNLPKKITYQE